MVKTVEFLFDLVSPTAYLAYKRLPEIARRTGATIKWTPVFLGAIMKATGNAPPGALPARGAYLKRDWERCAARYGIAYAFNRHFPVNTLTLQRVAVALLAETDDATFRRFLDACFDAIWIDGKDMGDATVAAEVLHGAGFTPEALLARADDPAIKARLKANTDEAVARGVFGAPTLFVGEEMFFGHDRLDYVEVALTDAG